MSTTQAARSLLTISDDLLALDNLMEELGGDLSDPQVEAAIVGWFEHLGEERDKKIDNYCALIRELELRASVRKAEAERLAMRGRTDNNKVEFLKGRLKQFFEFHKLPKIETERFTVAVQKNGGVLPLDIAIPPEQLPEIYRVEVKQVKPLTDVIRRELEAGRQIDGCTLGERGTSLRIR